MKNKINYLLIVMFIVLSFAQCSSDDDKPEPSPHSSYPKLALEKSSIDVKIGTPATVNIKNGGGKYHVFSANPSIATVELKDSTLTLHALSLGETSMIISDKNNQYTTLNVKAFYTQIALEQNEIIIKKRLGNHIKKTIHILKGNPDYQAKSENEKVATVEIDKDQLIVTALTQGETNIEITDSRGLKLTIPIKITETTEAYTPEELDKIKADDSYRYFYNGEKFNTSYSKPIREFDNAQKMYKYGPSWYSYYYFFYLYFPIDKSVGKKPGSKISYKIKYGALPYNHDIEFEIIKNDGTKFWAVYSFIEQGVLNYGYFCDSIN